MQQGDQPLAPQAKLEIGEERDELEREADNVAERVMKGALTGTAPPLQPPPPLSQSSGLLIQRATEAKEGAGVAAAAKADAAETAPKTLSLIVEDETDQLAPGQMRKSEFLAELRREVCDAADAELKRVGRDTESCPYITRAFAHYQTQDSRRIERGLRRYAPEAKDAKTAQEYIGAVSVRVARAVGVWAETGEVGDVPEELAAEMSGMGWIGGASGLAGMADKAIGGLIGRAGKAISGLGRMLFKERAGGARTEHAQSAMMQTRFDEGQALDTGVRTRMEGAFGHDFSRVRVYADSSAAELSTKLNARAFTVGQSVGFGAGEYRPGTPVGDALIAHELAHVVQQDETQQSAAAPVLKPLDAGADALEDDADEAAVGAVASIWGGLKHGLAKVGKQAMPRLKSGLQLQRCGGPKDYEVKGVSEDLTIASIYFDRKESDLNETQQEKIKSLKSPAERPLRLYSFISEDENVPPEEGKKLAHERYAVVDKALRSKPDPHTGDQLAGDDKQPAEDTTSSRGQWRYREWRKVKVVPADKKTGEGNCAAGAEKPCSDESKFTSAQTAADAVLTPAIGILGTPLSEQAKGLLDTHFHTTTDETRTAAATVVKDNLTKVKAHIMTQMSQVGTRGATPADRKGGHVCANECDPTCVNPDAGAYNNGTDDRALMTLCDTEGRSAFMKEADEKERAIMLIHEGLHGVKLALPQGSSPTPGGGGVDYSYEWQRLINFLDTPTALKNNDSYVLFIREVNGGSRKSPMAVEDTEFLGDEFLAENERKEVDRAVAWLAGWLLWAQQDVSSLYKTIRESREAKKWTNQYYRGTMAAIAPLFELTPPSDLPTEDDQFKVAAIHDRLFRLSRLFSGPIELKKNKKDDTKWGEGPARNLSIGPDFFKVDKKPRSQLSQLNLLITRILEASSDISSGARPKYLEMLDKLRQHKGGGAPQG
jgi:hypothetical protein